MAVIVQGDKELIKKLNSLSGKEGKKAILKGTRAACKELLPREKQALSVRTGAARNSLKVRSMKRSRKGFGTMITSNGKSLGQGDQFYLAFLEWGHKLGKRPTGKFRKLKNFMRKKVEGKFQLTHAAKSDGPTALNTAIDTITVEIAKIWESK